MKKFKAIPLALLLLTFFLVNGASANKLSVTGFVIDDNGLMSFKELNETHTTNDTITTAESGKHFLANVNTGTLTYTLPTAATGLTYKFTAINGNGDAGQGTVILSPQTTDTFVGCTNVSTASTFTAGDDLDSARKTGDSVRITGTASNTWICSERVGAWVDGN